MEREKTLTLELETDWGVERERERGRDSRVFLRVPEIPCLGLVVREEKRREESNPIEGTVVWSDASDDKEILN